MIPLHKVPRGLLEILRARTLGRSPAELSEAAVVSLDATSMYASDLQAVNQQTTSAAAFPLSITSTQQFQGRLFAMNASVVMGAAAGTRLIIALSYSPAPQFNSITLAYEIITAGLAPGTVYNCAIALPSPIVFNAGSSMTAACASDAGGADHVLVIRQLFENYSP